MIVDAHIHMYPPEVYRDPMSWARRADEPYWALLITDRPGRPSIQGWATVERLLSDMDRAGVERVVMQGMYWQHLETCVAQNNWYIEWCRQHPDRLIGFAYPARIGTDDDDTATSLGSQRLVKRLLPILTRFHFRRGGFPGARREIQEAQRVSLRGDELFGGASSNRVHG